MITLPIWVVVLLGIGALGGLFLLIPVIKFIKAWGSWGG